MELLDLDIQKLKNLNPNTREFLFVEKFFFQFEKKIKKIKSIKKKKNSIIYVSVFSREKFFLCSSKINAIIAQNIFDFYSDLFLSKTDFFKEIKKSCQNTPMKLYNIFFKCFFIFFKNIYNYERKRAIGNNFYYSSKSFENLLDSLVLISKNYTTEYLYFEFSVILHKLLKSNLINFNDNGIKPNCVNLKNHDSIMNFNSINLDFFDFQYYEYDKQILLGDKQEKLINFSCLSSFLEDRLFMLKNINFSLRFSSIETDYLIHSILMKSFLNVKYSFDIKKDQNNEIFDLMLYYGEQSSKLL